MRPRRPPTPSCATSWEPSSSESPSAGGRGNGPAADERERTRRPPGPHTSTKAWLQPYARKTHGGRSHAFLFGSDFEKKESGPNISARPAYIRGANDRIRTGDLRFTRALLYQLSHVGTRLLAKREYELYRRACRFARGKCNFSGERAGIRRFSTGLHPCLYDPREPHRHTSHRCCRAAQELPWRALSLRRPCLRVARCAASPPTPRSRGPSPPVREPGPLAARSCSRYPACRAERPDRGCP